MPRKTGTVQAPTPAGLALAVRSVIPPSEKDPTPKPAAAPRPAPPRVRVSGGRLAALAAACLAGRGCSGAGAGRAAAAAGRVPALPPFDELAAELDRLRGRAVDARAAHAR